MTADEPQGEDERAFSELIALARDGEESAVAELHRRYEGVVTARVRAKTSKMIRRRYGVDDVAQSVFVEVLRDIGRFEDRGEQAFLGWLGVKVDGKVRQKLSRLLKPGGGRREVTAGSEVLATPIAKGPGPATGVGQRDDVRRLHGLVDRLTAEQREVVLLRTQERLGFAEIAERLGLGSADAARMRFARGLEKLRETWDKS